MGRADAYIGLRLPAWASTGRGFNFLFSYPAILVWEHPDIVDRLKEFRRKFVDAYRQELDRAGLRLDNTQDLRRMVRIYGTAKPDVGIVSRFHGAERTEDGNLRAYLLALEVRPETPFLTRPDEQFVGSGSDRHR